MKKYPLIKREKKRARHQGAIAAIELEGRVLRAVQAAPKITKIGITNVAAKELDLPDVTKLGNPEDMGKAIRKALDSLKVSGPFVMGIPRNQVVLRTLALPETKHLNELASMVHFQIAKELPFRIEESVIDFTVHRTSQMMARANVSPGQQSKSGEGKSAESDKCEVLVAAVKMEVVEFYTKVAAVAGIKLVALGLQAYSNVRGLEACGQSSEEGANALISLRSGEVLIDIIDRQALLYSRGVGIPAGEAGKVESSGIEIIRSLNGYEGMQTRIPVKKVLITGSTGLETKLASYLSKQTHLPCAVLDLVAGLNLPESASEHASGALSTVGLALGVYDANGLAFDFLNPKRPAPPRNVRRTQIIMGTVLLAASLVLLLAIRSKLVEDKMKIYRQLNTQISQEEKKRTLYKTVRAQELGIKNWMKETENWLDHYAYLSALLPPSEEVYLTLISVSGQGAIHMGVQAKSGEILAKLEKQLRSAGYGVKPLAVNPGSDKYGYAFRSNIELIVPDKMKIDLAKAQAPERPSDDSSLQSTKKGMTARIEKQRVEPAPEKPVQPVAPKAVVPQEAPEKPRPVYERPARDISTRDTSTQEGKRPYPGYNRDGSTGRTGRKRGNE